MTYRINGEKVTLEEFRARARKGTPIQPGDRLHINIDQFTEFVSPVNGETIRSKHQLREHERKNNVVQVGDAFDSRIAKMKANKTKPKEKDPYDFEL